MTNNESQILADCEQHVQHEGGKWVTDANVQAVPQDTAERGAPKSAGSELRATVDVGVQGQDRMLEEIFWPFTEGSFKTHLSFSSISQAERCPEQMRRRYILGEKVRPGSALVWGTAHHQAVETNFRQKIRSHEDMPVSDVQEVFAASFDVDVEKNGGLTEIEWGHDKPGELKDAGVKLVANYQRQVAPLVQPVHVERKILYRAPGVPVPILGYIDTETGGSIIDHKTSSRAQRKPKPDWILQARIYQHAVKEEGEGGKPFEWHVCAKQKGEVLTSRHGAPELSLPPDDDVTDRINRYIYRVAKTISDCMLTYGPDDPWPGAITHPWACDFCGYRPTCAWWGNGGGNG